MPEFLVLANTRTPTCIRLATFARQIETLLVARQNSRTGVLACLDDLLGAVYNLFYAVHHEYIDRPQALTAHDIGNVIVRATDMADCKVRVDGKWTAGVYFNNALFRLAGVYHRVLKIAACAPTTRKFPHQLMSQVQKSYIAVKGASWKHANIKAIYREVNGLKHTPEGISSGRTSQFLQAVDAVQETLLIIEVLC
jgi:hypothetical protein